MAGRRGYFRKRNEYTTDPLLPVIKIKNDHRKDDYYQEAFRELLNLIFHQITPFLNYAHLNLLIPKSDLPLRFEGNHMDISYMRADGTLCFIQFHAIPPEKTKKKKEAVKWQRQG